MPGLYVAPVMREKRLLRNRDLYLYMAKKNKQEEKPVKLDMTYEEAMKKALSTPLPKKAAKKKK
jgi:hypothetical protein